MPEVRPAHGEAHRNKRKGTTHPKSASGDTSTCRRCLQAACLMNGPEMTTQSQLFRSGGKYWT